MIPLKAATDTINTATSSAATVDVALTYLEYTVSSGASVGGDVVFKNFSSATNDDTLVGPGGSNYRLLQSGTWSNKDASLACDVTISFHRTGGVVVQIFKITLNPGDTLVYEKGLGFFLNKNGSQLLDKVIIMTADVSNSTTSFADVTGLTCPLLANKRYVVTAFLHIISAATTTGVQIGYNIGAAPSLAQFSALEVVTNSATAAALSSGAQTARDTAVIVQTTGPAAIGPAIMSGVIQPSADGTFAIRLVSEVAASAVTVKAGSYLEIRQER
jgi:hypothetical protein